MLRGLWRGVGQSLSAARPAHFRHPQAAPVQTTAFREASRRGFWRRWETPRPQAAAVGTGTSRLPHAVLRSGIYGTVFLSIALLVTDESLDWATRQSAATQVVQDITGAPDHATQLHNFWAVGPALLQAHAGGGAEVRRHPEGTVRPTDDSGLAGELEVRLATAPDPENPGATLMLCQAAFVDEEEPEFYVATHHDRMLDAAMALIPALEDFAKGCAPARGALLVLYPDGNWYCLYFDGRRWLNMIFLEWQTAETMGFQ